MRQATRRRWRSAIGAGILGGMLLCLVSGVLSAQELPDTAVEDVLRKAQAIVDEYSPDKRVWVRPFSNGVRVVGVSVDTGESSERRADGPEMSMQLPAWLQRDALLGEVEKGPPSSIRLLWKVEPSGGATPEAQEYTLKLIHHQGYAQQVTDRVAVEPAGRATGTVFWSRHTLPPFRNHPPGLYDVFVSGASVPVETIPLGQVLVSGWATSMKGAAEEVRGLFPRGESVLAGEAVLARWCRYRFPVGQLDFVPKNLAVVSSADWIERHDNGYVIAKVEAVYPSGERISHVIELGRDTSSTWYNFHARGGLTHDLAPVAWSWRVQRETVYFDANAYRAEFPLDAADAPEAVEILYMADEGLLRLYGLVLCP